MTIKYFMKISLIIFLFTLNISAFQFSDLINKANKAYQQEQYQDALNNYLKIYKNGYESSELYYNIGNCYFRTGKIGGAILFYEKALRLNPDDEDALYNLSIAKARTVDKINDVPQVFIVQWWDSFLALFTLRGWVIILSGIYLLFIAGFSVYYFSGSSFGRRLGFYSGVFFLALTIFSGVCLTSKYNKVNNTHYGVLLTNTITVKQSPNEKAADAFVIHEGLKFSIEDELDDWVKIKLADGKIGWLQKNVFKVI